MQRSYGGKECGLYSRVRGGRPRVMGGFYCNCRRTGIITHVIHFVYFISQILNLGDFEVGFSIQSCGKPLQYSLCAEETGIEKVPPPPPFSNLNLIHLVDTRICRSGAQWCCIQCFHVEFTKETPQPPHQFWSDYDQLDVPSRSYPPQTFQEINTAIQ